MMRRTDIPFERDQSTRFLPWLVALMVFLGTLMLATAMLVAGAVDAWDSTLTGRMTVQIPARAASRDNIDTLTAAIAATPGVVKAQPVPQDEARALLVPWLGEGVVDSGLPVPALIDVETAPGANIDPVLLQARLTETVEGVAVDDHRAWLSALIDVARAAEALAFAILSLIASAAVIAVVFTTRSGLAVHGAIIELLHQMGARDTYIAGQFQIQAMLLALRGGIAGGVAAALVLLLFAWIGRGMDAAFLPELSLSPAKWGLLVLVPAITVAIAMLTARLTVLRALARMP
jgi:cell division transport system permease protein